MILFRDFKPEDITGKDDMKNVWPEWWINHIFTLIWTNQKSDSTQDTQAFEEVLKSVLDSLKTKISENKSLERQLYTVDEQTIREFLNKV